MNAELISTPYDLLALHKRPVTNHISGFCDMTKQLEPNELVAAYHNLRNTAPRRYIHTKRYFVGHSGYPDGDENSNRREEHLAIALCNSAQGDRPILLPDGGNLRLLDYQLPLKAKQGDTGVGKVDLFGVIGGAQPCVIELKIHPAERGLSDTPLRAFLEAFAYCAIVEANADEIAQEALEKFGHEITHRRPALIVMAPVEYWKRYIDHPRVGPWQPAMRFLADQLRTALGLQCYFVGLRNLEFTMGSKSQKPLLHKECSLIDLANLAT